MESRFTIVSFGEVLWDLLPSGPVLGGAPFNFAYRATTLGHRALIASRLGKDENGRAAFARIAELGMETGFVQWDPTHATGTVPVSFDDKGNHDFTITPNVAYDFIEPEDALLRLVAGADCFCYGTLAARNEVSRSTLKRLLAAYAGSSALLDLNLRKDCWNDSQIVAAIEGADILKLNDEELLTVERIYGLRGSTPAENATRLASMADLRCVVVTLGEGGAFAASPGRRDALRAGIRRHAGGYHRVGGRVHRRVHPRAAVASAPRRCSPAGKCPGRAGHRAEGSN